LFNTIMSTPTPTIAVVPLDVAWVLLTGINIAAIQIGFTLLEVGATQSKHVKSIIMKNLCDFSFGAVIWHVFAFGLFTGDHPFAAGPNAYFFLSDPSMFAFSFQQFGFGGATVSIVSGAILGRGKFEQYIIFSMFLIGLIYPVVAHWAWMPNGWLKAEFNFKDFAGSGVVHMVGGSASLVYAILCGPREGRFWRPVIGEKASGKYGAVQIRELRGHSPALSAVGV
jgi:Amt family ammonium transporter